MCDCHVCAMAREELRDEITRLEKQAAALEAEIQSPQKQIAGLGELLLDAEIVIAGYRKTAQGLARKEPTASTVQDEIAAARGRIAKAKEG